LAKLRLHIDYTLEILDEVTRQIGVEFRAFTAKTCPAFNTRELQRESDARRRRQLEKGGRKSSKASTAGTHPASESKQKVFSINTYKYHSLGDYANTIRKFGTSDSYSTEPVRSSGTRSLFITNK
jgi:hypothetical protein